MKSLLVSAFAPTKPCFPFAPFVLLVLLLLAPPGWAENNSNYVFNGTVTNFSSLNIPTSSPGTNNSLQILNGGAVGITNGDLTIGVASGDNNNYVLVSGTNTSGVASSLVDTNAAFSTIWVGSSGIGNQLIVTNGGQAIGGRVIIGYFSGSTGNTVIVTGSNSLLNVKDGLNSLTLGWSGGLNQLFITNGGRVNDTIGNVGNGAASASNNVAVVSGAGSVWSNSSTFNFGQLSGGNSLIISSGGRVDVGGDFNSYLGLANNSVLVTGSNSLLSLPSSALYMSGDNALLTIANGGRVIDSAAYLGYSSHTNNVAIVTGSGSVWSNSILMVGHFQGSGVQLIITNGGRVASSSVTLGNFSTSRSNTVLVTGSNSLMNLTGNLIVGHNGGLNKLIISDGGRVNNNIAYVGNNAASASNNSIVVTGSGSVWSNASSLYLGYVAGGNQLTISNGGRVENVTGYISYGAATASNTVIVTGSNSVWNNTGSLYVGYDGSGGNQLLISNGGRVNNNIGYVGYGANASNNLILVSGSGSVWSNSSSLRLGENAGGNTLIITNGGRVDASFLSIGGFAGTTPDNRLLVTGENSLLSMPAENLYVGGHNANVTIADSGRVVNVIGYVGNGSAAHTNVTVLVTGAGAQWTNSSELNVGYLSSGVQMIITNGGRVDSTRGFLAKISPSSNNTVVVTGSNSLWNISGGLNDFYIGFAGSGGNQLLISDGGHVHNKETFVGYGASAGNNLMIVSGSGSVWSNSSNLRLGESAGGNQLIITNGGRVDALSLNIGGFGGTTPNNRLVVVGTNSLLSLDTSGFGIGIGGHNARVTIADGGRVIGSDAYIGNGLATATNVAVIVTDPGSHWSNSSTLNVGWTASGTSLIITNGGRVDAAQTFVGRLASSTNNSVVVTGAGSFFGHRLMLWVGNNGIGLGSGTVLVENGGTIESIGLISGTGGSGTISNRAGIYQFTTATPTITTNTAGSIMMTNGTVSYRDVALADINNLQIDNITRQGNNTWRLNHSSNLLVTSYTFESVENTGNPLIYRTLSATNGSLYKALSTTIGTNGLAVGGGTDTFEFGQNFLIHSTNNLEFNLRTSTVLFNGLGHTNSITGKDVGGVEAGFYDNFAYGTLRLFSAADTVCFESGDGAASNALYVTYLDLPLSMTNFVANLHSPTNINLYYYVNDPRNAYLGGNEYQLTDCDGVTAGGFLLPAVPEPSSLLLVSLAACAMLWRRSHR